MTRVRPIRKDVGRRLERAMEKSGSSQIATHWLCNLCWHCFRFRSCMIQQYSATSYASDSPPCEIQQHFRRSCDPMRTITISISHQSCSYMMPFKFDVQKKARGMIQLEMHRPEMLQCVRYPRTNRSRRSVLGRVMPRDLRKCYLAKTLTMPSPPAETTRRPS